MNDCKVNRYEEDLLWDLNEIKEEVNGDKMVKKLGKIKKEEGLK